MSLDFKVQTGDFLQDAVLSGYGYGITIGALTTPIVGGGAGTVIDLDQPELVLSVPDGTTMLLMHVGFQLEMPADVEGEIHEIILTADRSAAAGGLAGNGTDENEFNLLTNRGSKGARVDAWSAMTSNITAPTDDFVLTRRQIITQVLTSGILSTEFRFDFDERPAIAFVGPAAVYGYWGGIQAISGFGEARWVEFDTSDLAGVAI